MRSVTLLIVFGIRRNYLDRGGVPVCEKGVTADHSNYQGISLLSPVKCCNLFNTVIYVCLCIFIVPADSLQLL